MSTQLSDTLTHLLTNWKSTVSGFLTITLVTTTALLSYPPLQAHLKAIAIIGGIQVLAKAYIALIQNDAPTVK
jgi:hypothetical protein